MNRLIEMLRLIQTNTSGLIRRMTQWDLLVYELMIWTKAKLSVFIIIFLLTMLSCHNKIAKTFGM